MSRRRQQDEDERAHLTRVAAHLAEHRAELRLTIRAIQSRQYSRERREAVIDRARRLVYRSTLLLRRLELSRRVH